MADRFDALKKLLMGGSANFKVPTERPGIKAQKKAFDTFQRASSALYQRFFFKTQKIESVRISVFTLFTIYPQFGLHKT